MNFAMKMNFAMNRRAWIMILALMVCVPTLATAAEWVTPALQGYGAMHPLPHAKVQPNPKHVYKAIFDVTSSAKDPGKINPGLKHVARALNVFASAGVSLKHLHFVAIVHGPKATSAVLKNAAYRKLYHVDNPNTKLLAELKKAGVKVFVCGQAMYDLHYPLADVSKDVHVALSALSTMVIYGDKGYAYVKQ